MTTPKNLIKLCEVCGIEYHPWRLTQTACGKSCARTGVRNKSYKHGATLGGINTKTISIWYGMRSRINSPDAYHKKYYGNIKLCKRWDVYKNFLEDMGECPGEDYSLDRIDNKGDYKPGNCRWATRKEQMNNTSKNRMITFNNTTLTQSQWADKIGINQTAICKRLKRGWSIERTLTTSHMRPDLIK